MFFINSKRDITVCFRRTAFFLTLSIVMPVGSFGVVLYLIHDTVVGAKVQHDTQPFSAAHRFNITAFDTADT